MGDRLVDRYYLDLEIRALSTKIERSSTALTEAARHLAKYRNEGKREQGRSAAEHLGKLEKNFLEQGGAEVPKHLAKCRKALRDLSDTEEAIKRITREWAIV